MVDFMCNVNKYIICYLLCCINFIKIVCSFILHLGRATLVNAQKIKKLFFVTNADLPDNFEKKHSRQAGLLKRNKVIRDIHRVYALIDTKSSALLTHVSLMIAACSFLASGTEKADKYFYLFFSIEEVIYMIISFLLLFCLGLSMYTLPDDTLACQKYYAVSCYKRKKIYMAALWLAKFVTFLVLLTVIAKSIAIHWNCLSS